MGSRKRVSPERKRIMWISQNHKCGICQQELKEDEYLKSHLVNIDHIVPRSKGGTNAFSNLQLTHMRCNHRKADVLPSAVNVKEVTYVKKDRLTPSDVQRHHAWTKQDYRCPICRDLIAPSEVYRPELVNMTRIVPKSHGGTRAKENMQLTHVVCHVNQHLTTQYQVIDNLDELGERRAV